MCYVFEPNDVRNECKEEGPGTPLPGRTSWQSFLCQEPASWLPPIGLCGFLAAGRWVPVCHQLNVMASWQPGTSLLAWKPLQGRTSWHQTPHQDRLGLSLEYNIYYQLVVLVLGRSSKVKTFCGYKTITVLILNYEKHLANRRFSILRSCLNSNKSSLWWGDPQSVQN